VFTRTCKQCGKTFEAVTDRKMYCPEGRCKAAAKSFRSLQRYYNYSAQRKRAIGLAAAAISRGELVRQPCEFCASNRHVEAHHDDYARPLAIRWLCVSCHAAHHREHGPGKNAFATQGAST
jgi:hypothetical protein